MKPNLFINKLTSSKINISLNSKSMKYYNSSTANGYYKFSDYVCNLTYTEYRRAVYKTDGSVDYLDKKLPLKAYKQSWNYQDDDKYVFTLSYTEPADSKRKNYITNAFNKFVEKSLVFDNTLSEIIQTYIADEKQKKIKTELNLYNSFALKIYSMEKYLHHNDFVKSGIMLDVDKIIKELSISNPERYLLYMCISFKTIIIGKSWSAKVRSRIVPNHEDVLSIPRIMNLERSINCHNVYKPDNDNDSKRYNTKKSIKNFKYTKNNRRHVSQHGLFKNNNVIKLPLFVKNNDNYEIAKLFEIKKIDIVKLFFNNPNAALGTVPGSRNYNKFDINNCKSNYSKRILGSLYVPWYYNPNGVFYANIMSKIAKPGSLISKPHYDKYYRHRHIEFIPGICNWVGRKIHVHTKFLRFHIPTIENIVYSSK